MEIYLNLAMTSTFLAITITITITGHHYPTTPSTSPSTLITMKPFPASATKSEKRLWVDDKVLTIEFALKAHPKAWEPAETLVKELIEQLKGVEGYAADVAKLYRSLAECYSRRESGIEKDWANQTADIIDHNIRSSSGA